MNFMIKIVLLLFYLFIVLDMEKSPVQKSPKGSLPYGWTVHVSTKYPDKVYYFNSITGDTTWDCPKLDPPRVLDPQDVCFFHFYDNTLKLIIYY